MAVYEAELLFHRRPTVPPPNKSIVNMNLSSFTNIAFISYKREDEKWAKWLQKKLEHYQLPIEVRKQNPDMEFAKRPRHVFKDTTDLSGGVLEKAIKEGLASSKYLIVICSPRAAKSPWVCKEVQEFIDSGREENIIPFIIDGEPYSKDAEKECFPESLKALAGEKELLGININENGRDSAAVKVIARLFDVRFDHLWQRFQREAKKRKAIVYGICLAFVILMASVAAWIGWQNYMIQLKNKELGTLNTELTNMYKDLSTSYLVAPNMRVHVYKQSDDTIQVIYNDARLEYCVFEGSTKYWDTSAVNYGLFAWADCNEVQHEIKVLDNSRGLLIKHLSKEEAKRIYISPLKLLTVEEIHENINKGFAQYLHFRTISQIHDNVEVTINYLPNNDCQVTFERQK